MHAIVCEYIKLCSVAIKCFPLHPMCKCVGHHVYNICPTCGKSIPQRNMELHHLQCEKLQAVKHMSSTSSTDINDGSEESRHRVTGVLAKASKSQKKAKKVRASRNSSNSDTTDDLDSMLAQLSISDSICNHSSCNKSVNVLGTRCRFCKLRFCMAHSIAEVHGCADAAKMFAREQVKQELKAGYSVKSKNVDPRRRAQLQQKLDKRIEELSRERQSKGSASKSRVGK